MNHTHDRMPGELLERLYRQHNDRALRALRRSLHGAWQEAAEDALADAWVILARKPASYLHDDEQLTAWLIKVARRLAVRQARREQDTGHEGEEPLPARITQLPDPLADVERAALARMELRELLDAITADDTGRGRTLTLPRRRALAGRMVGLSYQQMMTATGTSYTGVNRRLTEARRLLRDRGMGDHR